MCHITDTVAKYPDNSRTEKSGHSPLIPYKIIPVTAQEDQDRKRTWCMVHRCISLVMALRVEQLLGFDSPRPIDESFFSALTALGFVSSARLSSNSSS